MTLRCELVESLCDLEDVRQIRNDCREFMTRDREPITPRQQARWWSGLDENKTKLYVFRAPLGGSHLIIGFGLIRLMSGRWWLTGALQDEWRGKGRGEQLFRLLIERCWNDPVGLEVRADNERALKLYKKLGFVEASRSDGIITMYLEAKRASGQ